MDHAAIKSVGGPGYEGWIKTSFRNMNTWRRLWQATAWKHSSRSIKARETRQKKCVSMYVWSEVENAYLGDLMSRKCYSQ